MDNPREDPLKGSGRLRYVEELLFHAGDAGISLAAIAKRCGVNRTTIHRDIRKLMDGGVPIWSDKGRYGIDRTNYLPAVRFNLHEAMALFLAARLLTRYADSHHPHVARGIEKLAAVMPRDLIQQHMLKAAAVVRTRRELPELTRILERLTEAWANRKRVRLWEKPKENKPAVERLYEPYFLEPSGVGYSLYVMGYDHLRKDIRTFKIDRLARVEPTEEPFAAPADFDPYKYLHNAWGVNWGSGNQPVEVRLRFPSGRVADRVRESEWHYSQKREDLPDGGCILSVTVGSTLEMKPWIRQWGKDVIVLAPEELRREIAEEMREAARLYGQIDDERKG
ncbi:MAG TPA: transcriptional regulator [Anaerolineales bacterium]|nr:transcriptional regulator [Anaerolineales bacterium]